MYDIIGDIHGHADELLALLALLGYERAGDTYRHPARQALFVGDFIDRGPKIREVLVLVRSMVEAGSAQAVMGNHEFNAIAYHTPNPNCPSSTLRKHTEKNEHQHKATLKQLGPEIATWVEWFKTLPFALDLGGVRVVHACWDPVSIKVMEKEREAHDGMTAEFMAQATQYGTPLFTAVENVLKGPELKLPFGSYLDKEGHERHHIRTRWFEAPAGRTYAEYALPENSAAPKVRVPDSLSLPVPIYDSPVPVFFGHYWLKDETAEPLASNIACVDYSVAKRGQLCAYRWSGEQELRDKYFVTVPAADGAKE